MKNLKIFFSVTMAIVAGFLLTACNDDDFKAGPQGKGAQVYFPEGIATSYNIGDEENSIAIPVYRVVKEKAMEFSVLCNEESGLFEIPASVAFAAGEEKSELLIKFDRKKLQDGKEYPLELLLNDADNTTPYGNRMLKFTVMPWPWEELRDPGKYREGWLVDVFEGCNLIEIEVKMHKHKSRKGVYMIEQLFGWPYLTELFGATKEDLEGQFSYTPSNIVLDCSNPDQVTIAKQWSGITENSNGYGKFMIQSEAPGKLDQGVITFPAGGISAELVGLGQSFPTNNSASFRILLPGTVVTDYALTAEYKGMKVNVDNTVASAMVDFGYGADVAGISYAILKGNVSEQLPQIAADMAAGKLQNVNEVSEFVPGKGAVSVEAALEASGSYTLVALPKGKEGKLIADQAASCSFFFPGLGGASRPECELAVMLGYVSEHWPEQAANCPDEYSLYFEVTGKELKSLQLWRVPTQHLEAYLAQEGATEAKLIEALGQDQTEKMVPSINKQGGYGSAFINLMDNTSYTLLARGVNIYGAEAIAKATFSTKAVAYNGELVIGSYQMKYAEDSGFKCENVFHVHATAGSTTDFLVSGLGATDSDVQWYAKYDPAAATLTLDGTAKGYEKHGNVFGKLSSNFDPAGTYFYTWFSFVDPQGQENNLPFVIKVNTSKQLAETASYLHCPIFKDADNSHAGDLCYFPLGTAVTPYAKSQKGGAAEPMALRTTVPYDNVRTSVSPVMAERLYTPTAELRGNRFDNMVITSVEFKSTTAAPQLNGTGQCPVFPIRKGLTTLK